MFTLSKRQINAFNDPPFMSETSTLNTKGKKTLNQSTLSENVLTNTLLRKVYDRS